MMPKKIIISFLLIVGFFIFNTYEIETIDYNKDQIFFINNTGYLEVNFPSQNAQSDSMVTMHSINCKIKINFNDSESDDIIINQKNSDIFSFRLNKYSINNTKISITTLKYATNEREEENTKNKTCPVVITNFYIPDNDAPIFNLNDSSHIYFDGNLKNIQLDYHINEINLDEPVALSISFNQKSTFEINVEKDNEIINKIISNSTNIFLTSQYQQGDEIHFKIKHVDESAPVFVAFKMIKKNSISILEQNNLNLGFISSKIKYQYYYMEVFKEQEGEIMLHNKRTKGELFAFLIEKEKISNLSDINLYPKLSEPTPSNSNILSDSNDLCDSVNSYYSSEAMLEYNPHTAKLYFNYKNTSKCENGCYLLMTYYKEIIDESLPLIGYEYTILSRIWDYYEYSPQIINIPFNEYILGSFDEGSISHHYYSIFIPDDAEKIIIQIESNYLDAFIGEGIVKLNTIKKLDEIINLEIYKNQDVIILSKNDFDFTNKYISLALRSKNYFEEIFSFYYFRIFYLKKGETLYYPLDSYLGNLCSPEEQEGKYVCNVILENNYNEFSSNFSVSGSNEIEYFVIYYAPLFKNKTMGNYNDIEFRYLYNVDNNTYQDIDKYFFRYEFSKKGIKNIISAFNEVASEDCIQIYSSRMFHLYKHTLNLNFNLKYNYTLTYKHVGGWIGGIKLNYANFQDIFSTRNFRGKPIVIQITDKKIMKFWCLYYDFSFYLKLNYNMRNKGIEEITSEETRSEIIIGGYFLLYYYLNVTNKHDVNIDINIRLNSYDPEVLQNNFEIKGFIVDEDSIKRKLRGEYIVLTDEDAILGSYMESYHFGYIQINKEYINNNDYVLIRIENKNQTRIDTYFLVEIVVNEYQDRYFMPVNQYLIESFTSNYYLTKNVNKYYLDINNMYNIPDQKNSSVLVEFSPNYNDLYLNFETNGLVTKDKIATGFYKYRIISSQNNIIYFNITNPNNRTNANYFLRYYYSDENGENNYFLDPNFIYHENKSDSESVSIYLTFNNINIIQGSGKLNYSNYNITFYIYAYLYEKNDENGEQVNVSALIHKKPLYEAKTESSYFFDDKFNIYFDKILRKHNYLYTIQFKITTFIKDNIFNEELLTFTADLDLRNIGLKNDDSSNILLIVLMAVIVAILIGLIILFFVYRKVRRDNTKLKEKVLSLSFSSGIERNILKEEKTEKKDDDYETTFI